MLDDVAAFLIVAPLAGSLLLVGIVAVWLARGDGRRPKPAPTTLVASEVEVSGRQKT